MPNSQDLAAESPAAPSIASSLRADLVRATVLAVVIAAAWCFVHDRLTLRNWGVPLRYANDALTLFTAEKSALKGYFVPLLPKFNPQLGAPYSASWNDFPMTDEPLVLLGGLLARFVGLFAAANALVLVAHILAGLSFYTVCRALRYRWQWSLAGSLAFALSPFAFQRGLPHMTLTYYWPIPLCLLVCWWCGSRRGLDIGGRRFWLALGVAAVTGFHNPYYTNLFLQFLGCAAVAQLVRRSPWKKVAAPIVLGAASLATFLAMNLDTIYYQAVHGRNPEAVNRSYAGLETYALKPVELLIPPRDHRSAAARAWDLSYRYDEERKPLFPGEVYSSYLGLAGVGSLLGLALVSVLRVLGPMRRPLPTEALQTLWVVLYSVIGGLNGLFGQAGLTLFRCTNRYSIYILALSLLFGVRALSRLSSSWRAAPATLAMLFLAAMIGWDQLPFRQTPASIAAVEDQIRSDGTFTAAMEKALRPSAMVFQMPVMPFPESGQIEKMTDYEHLRPYLYSSALHYSYGSIKGRGQDAWQHVVERLPVPSLVGALERAGFSAIFINRKGYADRGAALVSSLQQAGRAEVIESPAGDLVCVLLHAATKPELPELPPGFTSGWYPEESNSQGDYWRYSRGNAQIVLHNATSRPQSRRLAFELASPSPRTVEIWDGSRVLYRSPPLTPERMAHSLQMDLPPGDTTLVFKTEPPVRFLDNIDTRVLGFLLYNLKLSTDEAGLDSV